MNLNETLRFELVRPSQHDAELILKWRNDPDTLANSYHSEPKEKVSFIREFQSNYFLFPDLPPLFALEGTERIAFLRFDPVEDFAFAAVGRQRRCCSISINVAPLFRGKGIGSIILEAVKSWVKQQGYEALYGEVKVDNTISKKAFLSAGYRQLGESIKIVDDVRQVPIIRFVADLVPEEKSAVMSTFIIAEAGSNWRMGTYKRDLAMAKTLIAIAAEAKADAVKFQVFRPESIYVENAGSSGYLEESGIEESMSTLFEDLMMPYEMIEELHAECKRVGIEFMATPFSEADFKAVDPYVKRHKIASYELNHPHLLKLAAQSGKPLLLSTGASVEDEIDWAVKTFFEQGGQHLALLQCTACYPAPSKSMNLQLLPWMKQRFKVDVGLSDHSTDPGCAPIAAVALGATVIEKHFTLDKRLPGPDHPFALNPDELKQLVQALRQAEQMKGSYVKVVDPVELELRSFARRGIQAIQDIPCGTVFHEGVNVSILRPGKQFLGLHPKYMPEIEGKSATRTISLGCGIQREDFVNP
ncbi:MAG: GNAT family N-acetyltransferase [Parachlamydiaceae bacterium]|nr:GNAT family N-acetyltransferase [Parachlamydiaceae bacterium]